VKRSKASLATILTSVVLCAPSYALDMRQICHAARAPHFNEAFTFMRGGGESCAHESCNTQGATLGDRVFMEISQDSPKKSDLRSMVEQFSADAAEIISDTLGISFLATFEEADTFIFFLVVSPRLIEMIGSGEMQEIDAHQFNSFIRPALSLRKCAGIVTHVSENGIRRIKRALIFVPDTLEAEKEVRSCVFEEIMNASGLLRDPPGSASLFDNSNYSEVDGSITYSDATLAMLYLHYELARGAYDDLEDFRWANCGQNIEP
jgi:hypothetical protein